MDKQREEFEAIPEIAERLSKYEIIFYKGEYVAGGEVDDCKLWIALGFIGGAWLVWQKNQEDLELNTIADSRAEQKGIKITLDEL